MNSKINTLLAVSAIGMSLAALPAFGSEFETLRVNVPFSFTAGKTAMPAGEYTVTETDTHVLMLRGDKASVLLLGTPGVDAQDDKNSLGFERTSKGLKLTSVHTSGRASNVVPAPNTEK